MEGREEREQENFSEKYKDFIEMELEIVMKGEK